MQPVSSQHQPVTLYDYFLQAKEAKQKNAAKLPSANSDIGDSFLLTSSTTQAIKKSPAVSKLAPGTLIDLESTELLQGFQKRPAFNPENIQMDDLVLSHTTSYIGTDGNISPHMESGYSIRPTIHFALNHPVGEVSGQGTVWKSKKYCLLFPFKEGLKRNGKPAGCLEVDTYWDKPFDYNSNQAILIVQKDGVPSGKAEVLSPTSQGLPEDSNVLVLAANTLPQVTAKKIIPKMGFALLEPGETTWGDKSFKLILEGKSVKDVSKVLGKQRVGFKRFLKQHHLPEMQHSLSLHFEYEGLLRRPQMLQLLNQDEWQYDSTDYKAVLLKKCQRMKQELPPEQQKKLKIKEVEAIIQNAERPSDAVVAIQGAFTITHILEPIYYEQVRGLAKKVREFPDQKKELFENLDRLFRQNLSEEAVSEHHQTKANLLGSIPIYEEDTFSSEPDLKAMQLARLREQEDQALLALLQDASQNPDDKDYFSRQKKHFQKIRATFKQKIDDLLTGKVKPSSYRDMLAQNLPEDSSGSS